MCYACGVDSLSLIARRSKALKIFEDPETMETIVGHVANGGTLFNLCEGWGIPFSNVLHWICASPDRKQVYDAAIKARLDWSIEAVLSELRILSLIDFRSAFGPDGALLPIDKIPADVAKAIQAVEVEELFEGVGKERAQIGWTKKVKFWDKLRALELLGKNMKLFTDRVEVEAGATLEQIIMAAHKRPEDKPI